MSFTLSTVFILSHMFQYVVASFSLNSKKSLIFLKFLPWPSYHWVEHCSASMYMWAFYWFMLLLRADLVFVDLRGCMGFFFSLLVSVETCFMTDHMVSFGEDTMRCWEEGIFFCFRMEYSTDLCKIIWFITSFSVTVSLHLGRYSLWCIWTVLPYCFC